MTLQDLDIQVSFYIICVCIYKGYLSLGVCTRYAQNNMSMSNKYLSFSLDNFQALVQGLTNSNKSAADYIIGVCSAAILIFCIGLVWGMIIIWLKTRGPKKVGFLAGRLIHPDYIEQS